jgi:hypothetical protein
MESTYFRQFLAYLSILTVALTSFFSSTCNAGSLSTGIRGSMETRFRFEDYDVKSPEVVKTRLTQLFPKGSSSGEFKNAMEQLGAKCSSSDEIRKIEGSGFIGDDDDFIYCHYSSGNNPFVKSKWVVTIKVESGSKVDGLEVESGLVGL